MKIKVFTFNLRTNSLCDGINIFPNRKPRILETINKYSPDLIGFQEANNEMRAWLRDVLENYEVVGCGRNADYRGESTVIAYRKDMFEMIKSECFWLSLTPGIPGSGYGIDQSSCPRITTAAYLKHRDSDEPFVFCNTHLDHKGKTARLLGAVQILQYLSETKFRFILTGDFNANPSDPEIKIFTESKDFDITDATRDLDYTFHDFGNVSRLQKIDYIFTDMSCDTSESFVIPDEAPGGIYISDHYPVCAKIDI